MDDVSSEFDAIHIPNHARENIACAQGVNVGLACESHPFAGCGLAVYQEGREIPSNGLVNLYARLEMKPLKRFERNLVSGAVHGEIIVARQHVHYASAVVVGIK